MELREFEAWFIKNPKGLFKEMIDHESRELRSDTIAVIDVISHVDTVTSYLDMLRIGIQPEYYTALLTDYITEYNRLKNI